MTKNVQLKVPTKSLNNQGIDTEPLKMVYDGIVIAYEGDIIC